MDCGTIFQDAAFPFSDGLEGNKLAIVLCEYGTNHLIVKVTSQQHAKGTVHGCQINDKPPNYFLPKGKCWFDKNTWVELDEVYEHFAYVHKEKVKDATAIEMSRKLDMVLMKEIIDCALLSQDVDEFLREFLASFRAKL